MTTTSSSIFYLADAEYSVVLDPLTLMVQERLSLWFSQEDYLSQLAIPFGATADTEAWASSAEVLRQSILNGTYSIRLEVRSGAELEGAQGAYSATGTTGTPTIYLNEEWLANATAEQIEAVLIEELGHSFDHILNNGVDSQGDEGEIFANLVLNTGVNTAGLLQQSDHYTVTIEGQPVAIEAAAWGSANVAQTFYLPMAENDVRASLLKISTATGTEINTVISMVSTSNGTIIVYDHWEDGYEADINNPTQSTTQIWGDGNLTNGAAPGDTDDFLARGQVITLINPVSTPRGTNVLYDGRDRIGATKAISVTKAGWATSPGTVLAGAINVYDVGNSGKSYVIPVGQNTVTNNASPNDTANRLFEYTSLHIIAYEDGTTVNVDLNGDGTISGTGETTFTLNQGQSYLVNGGVLAGTKVTSSKAIGVYSIAGDVGSSYENRWLAITPTEQWYNSYFAPVSTTRADAPAHVFLYNPNSTAIAVTYDTQTTKGNTITVAAKSNAYVVMPASAAHFYTVGGENFFAISTIDSDATANQSYDWSYSLVPESYLTDKFVVAWGPGYNNTGGVITTAKNGSPVWVTAPKDTTIYIDFDGDGFQNGDANDSRDFTYNLKALESYRIGDPLDKDQSGLTVYTTDGTLITAAWGEDPSVADAGNPYLDMGTTVLPFPDYVFQKVSKEASTLVYGAGVSDNDTNVELGEQIEYTVSVTNRAVIDLFNVNIKDSIDPSDSATYVPNSTVFTIYDPNGNIVISSVLGGNGFPLEGAGYTITDADPNTPEIDGLKRGYKAVIKYRVEVRADINSNLSTANYTITNNATLTGNPSGGEDITKEVENETKVVVNSYDGQVSFYKSDFSAVATTFQEGNTIGIQVIDRDPNKTSTTAETLTVTVTNTTTGETEVVTLTETGVNTGIFQGTLATSTTSSTNGNNSGTLYMVQGDSLKVEYTDPVFGSVFDNPTAPGIPQIADTTTTNPLLPSPGNNSDGDTSTATGKANTSTASVAVPSKTKILYLSADAADNDGTGDLDRINPADPDSNPSTSDPDTSLSSTTNITPAIAATGGGSGTYIDNFSTAAYNNSNGTESWASTPWVETGDDGSATTGTLRVNTTGTGAYAAGLAFWQNAGNDDIQRSLNLSSADTSQAITLSFTLTADSLVDTGENVTLEISTDGGTSFSTITLGSLSATSGTISYNNGVFRGDNDGSATYSADIKSLIASATNKSNIIIRFNGNSIGRSSNDAQFTVDNFQVSFTKTGTPATPAVPATFTQSISMADDFVIPASGEIKVVTYVSGLSGGTPTSGNITAALTYGASGTGSSLVTLTTFAYTDTGSGTGFITWTGTVPSGVTIPAGQKVQLLVTNNQSGLRFKVDYDSNTKPSRIELSTTTVIDIEDVDNNAGNGVQEIGFYNNSFANNGSLINSGTIDAGQIVYLRVKVSDPFGDYDITGLTITIDGPGTDGDQTVTLTNANVINAAGDGGAIKTYEYAWQTINNTGVYNITVVAKEGSEGITASATSNIIVTAQDLGTPSTTEFVDINGNIVNQYTAGATAYLQVTDMDEGGSGTIKANVQLGNGTIYEVTLTETSTPGIFRADLGDHTKFTGNPFPGGTTPFENLLGNSVLNANYVDNDDATDTSNDTISVGNQPPTLDLDPTNGNTVNNTAIFNEGTGTGVAFTQTGQSIGDDSGNLANLKISFLTASISDGANEKLQFNGATSGGSNITSLDLNFTTGGTNTVLIAGVTYIITRTVDLGTGLSALTFTNNAGGNLTVAQTETLLDSLRYFNSSANPTDGNREFTAIVNDGSLNSNSTTFTVDVNPINDAPAGTDKGFNLASNSSITLTVSDFGFSDPNDSPANNLQAVKISSLPTSGTLYYNGLAITGSQITAGYFVSVNDINAGKLTYTAPSTAGSPSFTFQVQDDGGTANGGVDLDQSPNTITFTVAPNVPPVVDLDPANATLNNTATFTEMLGADTGVNAIRFSLDTGTEISITDTDSPNLANLKVSIAQSQIAPGDQLRFGNIIIDLTADPDTTPTSGQVTYNGTVFGYVVSDDGSGNRIITFTSKAGIGGIDALAPKASYEALIDALKYNNTSDTPVNGSTRNFSVTANDGQADSVTPAVFTVTIQATPEPPDIDLDLSVASKNHTDNFIENATNGSQVNAVPFVQDASIGGNSLTDIDSLNLAFLKVSIDKTTLESGDQVLVGGQTIDLYTGSASGTVIIGGVTFNYNFVDAGNTRTLTFSNSINGGIAPLTAYEALLDTLKYNNSSNNLPSNSSRIFSLDTQDQSGLASNTAIFTVNITVSNGAPVLDLDAGDTGTLDNVAVFTEVAGTDTGANAVYFAKGMAVGNNQSGTNVADADSDLSNFKVSISQAQIAAGDQLRFGAVIINLTTDPDTTPITGEVTYNSTVFRYTVSDDGSGNRILTFTSLNGSNGSPSPAVIASYEALVDALQYNSTSNTPSGSRIFSNTLTDSGNLTSSPALFTVNLNAVNDPPVAVNDTLSTSEDTALVITANDLFGSDGTGNSNDFDVDSANFASITITELATNGTLQYFNGSTWVNVADEQVITVANLTAGNFRFVPTADYNGSANFKYKVSDGSTLSNEATVTITVNAVNDPPILDLDGSTAGFNYSTSYVGGGTGIGIADLDNSITDVDDTNIESATIILTNAKTGDVLNVPTIAGLIFNVNTATAGQITVTVTGTKTLDEYESAIRQITFSNPNANLDTTSRNITVQVNDGNNNSNLATTAIAISQGNTPPTLDLDPNDPLATSANNTDTFTENGAVVRFTKDAVADSTSIDDIGNAIDFLEISFANSGANGIQDGSNEQIRIAGTVGLVGGSIALNFANNAPIPDIVLGGITYNVTATVSGTTSTLRFTKYDGTSLTTAQAETLLDALGYYNSSENPTSGTRVFNAVVNDGQLNSNSAAFTVNVVPVNDAPSFTVATGKVVTDIGTNTIDKGQSVYLQPDGKILVGGQSDAGGNFALVRYNSDGSLDTSFGTGGKITANFVSSDDDAIFVQPDGKILVVGYSNNDIVVTRYNSNGTLDNSFGTGGTVTTDVGTNSIDFAFTLFVQADGRIVVSGESNNDFATIRYESNGTLDTSFGTGGKVVTHVGSAGIDTDRAYSTFVQADGKIVVTGYSNTDFALARYNSNGTLDNTFGTGGKVLTHIGSADIGYSAFSQPDGKIILAGESDNNFALVRYNSDGSLDNTFGTGGKVTTDINGSNDSGRGVFVTQDGKILLAGEANSTLNSFALVRYNSDGTLDTSFGTGGKVITDIDNGSFDYAFSIFVQPDGKIVVVGESDGDFATVRYNSDGTLDTTFGEQVSTLDNNPTYSFGDAPVVLDNSITLTDPELSALNSGNGNWNGATLTLARQGGANADDVFSNSGNLGALTQGQNLTVNGTAIGTVAANSNGTLVLTFNSSATNALVQQAIQQITYSNNYSALTTPPSSVIINYTLNDQNSNNSTGGTAGTGVNQGTGGLLTGLGSITVNLTDNRPIVIDTPTFNEGSPYAVFTVDGAAGQQVKLVIAGDSATEGTDFSTSLEYWNGTAWTAYTANSTITIPTSNDGGTTNNTNGLLYVRSAITNDPGYETGTSTETFTLTATNAANTPSTGGTASIKDDGTGTIYTGVITSGSPVTDTTSLKDDDRPLSVSSPTVTEGTDAYAIFEVTTNGNTSGQLVKLSVAGVSATGGGTDFGTATGTGLEYWNGSSWVVYNANDFIAVPANGTPTPNPDGTPNNGVLLDGTKLLVRTAIINDTNLSEPTETFTLTASNTGLSDYSGTGTITQPPTIDLNPANALTGTYPNFGTTGDNSVTFTEDLAAVAFTASGTSIVDDGNAISSLTISFNNTTSNIRDGAAEQILINGGTQGGNPASISLNFANGAPITNIVLGGVTYIVGKGVVGTASALSFVKSSGTLTKDEAETLLDALQYQNVGDNPTDGDRVFNLQVNDGTANSNVATLTVNVNPVNDNPSFNSSLDSNPIYSFGGSPTVLDGSVNLTDPELTARNNWSGATLTLQRDGGANAGDVFGTTGTLSFTGSNVVVGGTTIGTFTNTGGTLSITFNGSATNALVDSAIEQITYRNTETTPAANVTINYTINDQNSNGAPTGSGQDQGTGGLLTGSGQIIVDILKGIDDTNTAIEAGGTNNGTLGSNATGNVLINTSAGTTNEAGDDIYETPASLTVTAIRTGVTEGSGTAGTVDGTTGLPGAYGTITINANGSYTYVIDNNNADVQALRTSSQTLTDSFNYTLSGGGATDIAVLTITIQGANDNPVANPDVNGTDTVKESGVQPGGNNPEPGDDTATGNVLSNDTDVDSVANGETKTVVGAAVGNQTGPLTGNVGSVLIGTYGTVTIGANGVWTYSLDNTDPDTNALAQGAVVTDVFSYTMQDTAGVTSTSTLTVTINGTNDAPIALNDNYSISENGHVVGNMIYSTGTTYNGLGVGTPAPDGSDDSDIDDPLPTLTITQIIDTTANASGPVNILYTIVPGVEKIISLVSGATLKVKADGTFDYNPNTMFRFLQNGESIVEDFTYTLTDPHGATDTAVVSITINGTNDPPNATDDIFEIAPNTNLGGNVITGNNGNGADSDPDGDSLTVTALNGTNTIGSQITLTSGALLTLNSNGTFTYNSNGYSGNSDTFNYTITDEGGNTDTATVTINLQTPTNGRTPLYPGGTDAADNIAGTSGGDLISGGGNTDTIYGNGGSDEIYGDAGNDTLYGGTENDLLFGGDGSDVIYGNEDNDYIHGGLGADTINGGTGYDFLDYRSPTDSVWTYYRTSSADTLNSFNATEDTFIVSQKPTAFVAGSLKTGTTPPTAYTITNSARPTDSQIATLLTATKLPVNQAAFFYWRTSSTATSWRTYMVLNDGVAGYQANTTTAVSSDTIIDVSNYAGTISLSTFKTWAEATTPATNTWAIQDGPVNLLGGFGIDTLVGGGLGDLLIGAGGADTLTGGAGADKFDYRKLTDSLLGTTPPGYDYITDFNASQDLFLVTNTVSGFTPTLTINPATYSTLTAAAIQSVLNSTNFIANSAAQFTYGSDTFIAINDATAGYSSSTDALIKVTGYSGTFGVEDFTTVF